MDPKQQCGCRIVIDSPSLFTPRVQISDQGSEMTIRKTIVAVLALVVLFSLGGAAFAADSHTSSKFEGPKANTGTVTHAKKDGKN